MGPQSRIDTGPSDLAGHRNSAAVVFLDVYRDVRLVNNVILLQLSLDGRLRFATAEASHSNITDQRHRDVAIGAHASALRKIGRAIHCDLYFISGTDDECGGIGRRRGCLFRVSWRRRSGISRWLRGLLALVGGVLDTAAVLRQGQLE